MPLLGASTRSGLVAVLAGTVVLGFPAVTPWAVHASAETLPALAGTTTVSGVGSVAVPVALPAQVTFDLHQIGPWATIETSGRFGAVLLLQQEVGQDALPNGAPLPGSAFEAYLAPPVGCSPGVAGVGGNCRNFGGSQFDEKFFTGGGAPHAVTLPPGDYVLYAVTAANTPISATLTLPGLTGFTALQASSPINASFQQSNTAGAAAATLAQDEHVNLNAHGFIFGSTWSDDASPPASEPNESVEYQETCLYQGDPPDPGLNPVPYVCSPLHEDPIVGPGVIAPCKGFVTGASAQNFTGGWGYQGLGQLNASSGESTFRQTARAAGAGVAVGDWALSVDYLGEPPQNPFSEQGPCAPLAAPVASVPEAPSSPLLAFGGLAGIAGALFVRRVHTGRGRPGRRGAATSAIQMWEP